MKDITTVKNEEEGDNDDLSSLPTASFTCPYDVDNVVAPIIDELEDQSINEKTIQEGNDVVDDVGKDNISSLQHEKQRIQTLTLPAVDGQFSPLQHEKQRVLSADEGKDNISSLQHEKQRIQTSTLPAVDGQFSPLQHEKQRVLSAASSQVDGKNRPSHCKMISGLPVGQQTVIEKAAVKTIRGEAYENDIEEQTDITTIDVTQPPQLRRPIQNRQRNVRPGAVYVQGVNNNDNNIHHNDAMNIDNLLTDSASLPITTTTQTMVTPGRQVEVDFISPEELEEEYRERVAANNPTMIAASDVQRVKEPPKGILACSNLWKIGLTLLCVALLFLGGVVYGVLVHGNNNRGGAATTTTEKQLSISPTTSPMPTIAPTPTPTFTSEQLEFLNYLVSLSPDNGTALQDRSTSQFQAFDYVSNELSSLDSKTALAQRWALTTLYMATNGSNWYGNTYWLNEQISVCGWSPEQQANQDICLNTGFGRIALDGNNLIGTVPSGIFNAKIFPIVSQLSLSTNSISGTFPFEEIGENLDQLELLHIHNNLLSGTISTSIGKLSKLETISLSNNNFSGSIPSEFGELKFLTNLQLSNCIITTDVNNVTTIPSEIGKLTNLKTLDLSNNGFVGDIPSEIGLLTNLRTLLLGGNSFSNELSTELLNLLTSLDEYTT